MTETYYIARRTRLMSSFERTCRWAAAPLAGRYGKEFSNTVIAMAHREYEALIPQVPFIGGAKNRWTNALLESAEILAFFRAMDACGRTSAESSEVVYEAMRVRLAKYPRLILRLAGRLQFTRLFLSRLRRQATETQKRRFPGDFVAEIVVGDGKDFDWGIDFSECAIHKFYKTQNALDILPYVCKLDYLTSEAFGLGLARTSTLASGQERCDPRLKQGRLTRHEQAGGSDFGVLV